MDRILLLQSLPGFGLKKIHNFFKENSFFLEDEEYIKYFVEAATGKKIEFYLGKVERLKDRCLELGVEIIIPDFKIINSPLILYLKGDKTLLQKRKLMAVVGTREPSIDGINLGIKYVERIISQGWITVSGLARGCDTLCHRESIRNNGQTIAVIPGGYNKNLAPWILDSGLIISEYPPGSTIKKYRCIKRNRIITGLSRGLFIIESKRGGGSEHSIKYAWKAGIPIAYGLGFKGISKYDAKKIENTTQFDQYLEKCIK